MSKRRKILLMPAKGGVSQAGAAALHASKRDVSACAKAIRERGLTFDGVAAMGAAEAGGMPAPPRGPRESACPAPDMGPPIARKRRDRRRTRRRARRGRRAGLRAGPEHARALRDLPARTARAGPREAARAPARGGRRARRPGEVGGAPARRRRLPEGRRPRMPAGEHLGMLTESRARAMGGRLRETVEDGPCDRYGFEERMGMPIGAGARPAATAGSPSSRGGRGSSPPLRLRRGHRLPEGAQARPRPRRRARVPRAGRGPRGGGDHLRDGPRQELHRPGARRRRAPRALHGALRPARRRSGRPGPLPGGG